MDWIKSNSVNISEAIRQGILCAMLFGLLTWDTAQQNGVLMMVSAILALFTRSNTISTTKLDQRVEERVVQRDAGLPGPGSGTGTWTVGTGNGKILALVLAVGLMAGCASSRGPLLQADRVVHTSLASVQDVVDALCDSKAMALPNCQQFNRELVPALEAGKAFNEAVRAERVGSLGHLLTAVGRLTQAVTALVPESARPDLLKKLQALIDGAFTEVK